MKQSLCCLNKRIEEQSHRFAKKHPWLAFWSALAGVPAFILGSVTALTTCIMYLAAWLLGWL